MSFAQFLCLCFLCFLPLLVVAQTNVHTALISSLTAGDDGSPWVSPSGDFAFGFREVATGGFLLAIWFNKIPKQTIAWSANRDKLAQHGSVVQLNYVGKLVLSDPNGLEMWSKPSSGAAFTAAMLDTGNLVLYDDNSASLWQSFYEPTDTILPNQNLTQGMGLISQISSTNYSSGRFNLNMKGNAILVFSTLNWPGDSIAYLQYYTCSTEQSGLIDIEAGDGSVVAHVSSKQAPPNHFYQRAVLEFDGVFRIYALPRQNSTAGAMNWKMLDFVPQDICSLMNVDKGGGACGFNSYCRIGSDQRPECLCSTQWYSFFDEMDHMKGCKPDFDPQSCSKPQ